MIKRRRYYSFHNAICCSLTS